MTLFYINRETQVTVIVETQALAIVTTMLWTSVLRLRSWNVRNLPFDRYDYDEYHVILHPYRDVSESYSLDTDTSHSDENVVKIRPPSTKLKRQAPAIL